MKIFQSVGILSLLLSSLFFSQDALAAVDTQEGLVISPAWQEVVFKADEDEVIFTVELTNNTAAIKTLNLTVVDFGTQDEAGAVAFADLAVTDFSKKFGLAGWLEPAKNTVTIEPGQSQKIPVRVDNRDSLTPGGHYAAVLATVDNVSAENHKNVSVQMALSSLVFVNKTGGENYSLTLKSVEHDGHFLRRPKTIKLQWQNDGNVHVKPRGTVQIISPGGQIVSKTIINEQSSIVLPSSQRLLAATLKSVAKWTWPGKYQIVVNYRYDNGDDEAVLTQSFWWFGWWLWLAVAVLLYGLFWRIKKHGLRIKK